MTTLDVWDARLRAAVDRMDRTEAFGWVSLLVGLGCLAFAGSVGGLSYLLRDVM